MKQIRILMLFFCTLLAASPAAEAGGVKGGRAYIQAEKKLVAHQRKAREFAERIGEIDALRLPRRMHDFWNIDADLQRAMKREYARAKQMLPPEEPVSNGRRAPENRQDADTSAGAPNYLDAAEALDRNAQEKADRQSPRDRVRRMNEIMRELDGLRGIMMGEDLDVLPRYRHLLGEFLVLMQAEVRAEAEALDDFGRE